MKPLLAMGLIAATAAFAAERGFDRVVQTVESHYGVKRLHIPMMGLANMFLKVSHPAGAHQVKLAIFQDLANGRESYDPTDLDWLYDELTHNGLKPIVRVHSEKSHESTFICTAALGKTTTLVIATFDPNEATVVEVKMSLEALVKMLTEPESAGKLFGIHHDSW